MVDKRQRQEIPKKFYFVRNRCTGDPGLRSSLSATVALESTVSMFMWKVFEVRNFSHESPICLAIKRKLQSTILTPSGLSLLRL